MLKMNRALDSMEVLAQTGTDLLQEQFALMDYWNQWDKKNFASATSVDLLAPVCFPFRKQL